LLKLLITGAAGFIGYHLAHYLLKNNFEVFGIDNISNYYDIKLKKDRLNLLKSYKNFDFIKADIANKEDIQKVFNKYKPQRVINLAAQPGVRYSLTNPHEYMSSNLVGFLNIIELCKDYQVEGLIYASSSSVYGANKKIPFNTAHRAKKPISLYGATKRSNELIAYSYSHLYDLPTTGLRYFTVYGPWYRPDMGIFKFVKKIIKDKKIKLFNEGQMRRDFTYIDDIISGTVSAIRKNYNYEIFNLGNNKTVKLMDLIQIIESNIGKSAMIEFLPLQLGDMVETFADISRSKELLNFKPKTNLDQGIPKFIKWYREYYNV